MTLLSFGTGSCVFLPRETRPCSVEAGLVWDLSVSLFLAAGVEWPRFGLHLLLENLLSLPLTG